MTGTYGTLNMSTAEFLELFYDGFVSAQPSGMTVTKTSIGKDETGQYDMWEYDFCPTNYNRTILLSSGMHTYELAASFGLANFIGHLYTDSGNDAFSYIRNNVRIKVIPVVNPWGFNQYPKKYGNVNGVNPNRNFDLDGSWEEFPNYTPAQNEWNVKGESPFSEAEAHNLARWAETNWDAEFWIDCHTGEGYSDKDLWVYYSSDSAILDRINAGISRIETWFKETYGKNCVTTRTIDNPDSIRLHWAENLAGIPGMTLEQAPKRTTFGTSATNEAADISNYSTNISTFVQEFLIEKYRSTESVAIQSVSLADVCIPVSTPSMTITANIMPTNTTQNKFAWTSSNENVVKVYGGTEKAVIVRVGEGTATLTCKNRYNSSVAAKCTVTVFAAGGYIFGHYIDSTGKEVPSNYYVCNEDYIEVDSHEITILLPRCAQRIMVSEFDADKNHILRQATDTSKRISAFAVTLNENCKYIRVSIECLRDNQNMSWTTAELDAFFDKEHSYVINGKPTIHYEVGGISYVDGSNEENSARFRTDFFGSESDISAPSGYVCLIRKYAADNTFVEPENGNWSTNKTDTKPENREKMRLVLKKSDDSECTLGEMDGMILTTTYAQYVLQAAE